MSVIDELTPIKGRLQIYRLKVLGMKILWPIIYSPTDAQADSTKSKFYNDVEKAVAKAKSEQPSFKLVISGDFNATIGRDAIGGYSCIGRNNDPWPTNSNGRRLLEMAENLNLQILNTMFRTKNIHRTTFVAPGGRFCKRLDYFVTEDFVTKLATNCRVYRGKSGENREFGTDHRLLVLKLAVSFKRDFKANTNRSSEPRLPSPTSACYTTTHKSEPSTPPL